MANRRRALRPKWRGSAAPKRRKTGDRSPTKKRRATRVGRRNRGMR